MKRKVSRVYEHDAQDTNGKTLFLYTDGSDLKHSKNRQIGGGAVFVYDGKVATCGWTFTREDVIRLVGLPPAFQGLFSNPTAEMLAAAFALLESYDLHPRLQFKKVVVLSDYIQVFEYGRAKYRRPSFHKGYGSTAIYQKSVCLFLDAIKLCKDKGIAVEVRHVRAHSGVEYNELADKLAKQGVDAPNTVLETFSKYFNRTPIL